MKDMKRIQSLILTRSARLECPDSEYLEFNFADAINRLLLANINDESTYRDGRAAVPHRPVYRQRGGMETLNGEAVTVYPGISRYTAS